MDCEDFVIPPSVASLIAEHSQTHKQVAADIKKITDEVSYQLLKKEDTFSYFLWIISRLKDFTSQTEAVCDLIHSAFIRLFQKISRFTESDAFKTDPTFPGELALYLRRMACLLELTVKNCLKRTKRSLLESAEDRREKYDDPVSIKLIEVTKAVSRILEVSSAHFAAPDFHLHIFEALFYVASTEIINLPSIYEHMTKMFTTLLSNHEDLKHEWQRRILNLLEEGSLGSGDFFGRYLANLLNSKSHPGLSTIAGDAVTRLICHVMELPNAEGAYFKVARELFSILTEQCPRYFYQHFDYFEVLLSSENYGMRAFFCEGLFFVSAYVLEMKDLTRDQKCQKIRQYFQICCQRVLDKNSWARASVLSTIGNFLSLGILEKEDLKEAFQISCRRLTDSVSLVRKKAMSLNQEIVMAFKAFLPTYDEVSANQSKLQITIRDEAIEEEENEDEWLTEGKPLLDQLDENGYRQSLGQSVRRSNNLSAESNPTPGESLKKRPNFRSKKLKYQVDREEIEASRVLDIHPLNVSVLSQKYNEEVYRMITESLPVCESLLFSKNASETVETLRYLYLLATLKYQPAVPLYFRSFSLIFSREPAVRDEVLRIFHRRYITQSVAPRVVKSLHELLSGADSQTTLSIEEIISQLFKRDLQDKRENKRSEKEPSLQISIKKNLWEMCLEASERGDTPFMVSTLKLLRVLVRYYPQWVLESIVGIQELVLRLADQEPRNFEVLFLLASIVASLPTDNEQLKETLLKLFMNLAMRNQGSFDPYFVNFLERTVFLIFVFKESPEPFLGLLLAKMRDHAVEAAKDKGAGGVPEASMQSLMHFLSVGQEVALKMIYYFERLDTVLKNKKNRALENNQPEIDQATGGAEAEYEYAKERLELACTVTIFKDGLLGTVLEIALEVVQEYAGMYGIVLGVLEGGPASVEATKAKGTASKGRLSPRKPPTADIREEVDALFMTSLSCLAKMMIVSRDLCERYLTLLFDFLESPYQNQQVSCAIMIFLGDLFRRFPNHLTVHVVRMFSQIRSPFDAVRQTAFIVLSHLILNDFIKIKSEIAEFIFLLEDPDVRIQELTSIFFHEMTEKNKNFILNILPDAISRLSCPPEAGGLDDKGFETFAKHFLKFISKDHVSDHLIDKMMTRVRQIESHREIRNTIYCVFCLVSSEKMLEKLVANAEKLRSLLGVGDVREILDNLIFKLRAQPKIPKEKIDEFEKLLFGGGEQVFEEIRRLKVADRTTNMKKGAAKKKTK